MTLRGFVFCYISTLCLLTTAYLLRVCFITTTTTPQRLIVGQYDPSAGSHDVPFCTQAEMSRRSVTFLSPMLDPGWRSAEAITDPSRFADYPLGDVVVEHSLWFNASTCLVDSLSIHHPIQPVIHAFPDLTVLVH